MNKSIKCTKVWDVRSVEYGCVLRGGHIGKHVQPFSVSLDTALVWYHSMVHSILSWPPEDGWRSP